MRSRPDGVLSAYHDNSAVIEGAQAQRFFAHPDDHRYRFHDEPVAIQIKVETHNHPTAISPFPGAATGSGGEIRDEAATGRGARPKAGLTGFTVSNLLLPGLQRDWEIRLRQAGSHRQRTGNHDRRPAGCCGFQQRVRAARRWAVISAPLNNASADACGAITSPSCWPAAWAIFASSMWKSCDWRDGDAVIVLGGPAMLIGLGGGAASSMGSGQSDEALDFASVQRENPEMQRRCQEVIDACWALGEANPIVSIHDVGAGGLSNALPELLNDSERGGAPGVARNSQRRPGHVADGNLV